MALRSTFHYPYPIGKENKHMDIQPAPRPSEPLFWLRDFSEFLRAFWLDETSSDV
jgi:hypothetical protein